jgi:CheY-like chemotaxis protein
MPAAVRHVLVMDDDPEILELLKTVIAGEGHAADTASSGREGLKMLESREYDLILCDIVMPGFDGTRVFEEIAVRWPHLLGRLVFISGYGDGLDERARTFIASRGVPMIGKPFDKHEIAAAIRGKEY